jgi:hypothetical protein
MKRILAFGLFLAFLLVLLAALPGLANAEFTCADVTEIPQLECEALVALYNSTNGPGWYDNTNWLVTDMPSNWYGVLIDEIDSAKHVTTLNLQFNGLNGSIPPVLGNLDSLWDLELGNNQLTGTIPPELGGLSNLGFLNLNNNQLSGAIPAELGNLASDNSLLLANNQLSGSIPPELGNLGYLDLSGNRLSGIIPSQLGGVITLNLSGNQLSGSIPPELGNLELSSLNLNNNRLIGAIPAELGNLFDDLIYLDLSGNQLSGAIPTDLGKLKYLQILHLNDNLLDGDVPDSFVHLVNLRDPGTVWGGLDGLDLDFNALNIPDDYPNLSIPLHVLLFQKDPNWHTLQPVTQVIGSDGGMLNSLDGRTYFFFPAGALDGNTTFTFAPQPNPNYDYGRQSFAHNSFRLSAVDAVGDPLTVFNLPVTVTLNYADLDIASIPEGTLGLYVWEDTWVDALSTCSEGEYILKPAANTFSLPVCHMSEFAVLGQSLQIFIPLVLVQR